jgi:hypothetical protein
MRRIAHHQRFMSEKGKTAALEGLALRDESGVKLGILPRDAARYGRGPGRTLTRSESFDAVIKDARRGHAGGAAWQQSFSETLETRIERLSAPLAQLGERSPPQTRDDRNHGLPGVPLGAPGKIANQFTDSSIFCVLRESAYPGCDTLET